MGVGEIIKVFRMGPMAKQWNFTFTATNDARGDVARKELKGKAVSLGTS